MVTQKLEPTHAKHGVQPSIPFEPRKVVHHAASTPGGLSTGSKLLFLQIPARGWDSDATGKGNDRRGESLKLER